MVQFLRCPQVSVARIGQYLESANAARNFSNFGKCSRELQQRLSDNLSVPVSSTCTGSNATALLLAAHELILNRDAESCKVYFPVFSFFATFSIASLLDCDYAWYDLDSVLLPEINDNLSAGDVVYISTTFGTDSLEIFFDYATRVPCTVIVDAAACLPALLNANQKLTSIPDNVIVIFSLHATKLLSAGEGAFCVFGAGIPSHLENLTNFGVNEYRAQVWQRSFNAKMSEFNAAAALSSLDDLEENIETIINAKKYARDVGEHYNLCLYQDFWSPTLTLNIRVKDAKGLIEAMASEKYELRQWWSLAPEANEDRHPKSYKMYRELLGVPFDWSCIHEYFEDFCSKLTRIAPEKLGHHSS